jgi:capsular exopolysaccharide synthesis family protein
MTLNIILSVVVGLGTGIALAYFIEYLDTSVKTVDDIEQLIGTKVVGIIPQKVKPLIETGPSSPHAEAYRVLRTNLKFSGVDDSTGVSLTVTSGGVGEGKSLTLFNLAYICATLGDRVLIIDSDMRRPRQHSIMGMSNDIGLADVLFSEVSVSEAIFETEVDNLFFMPSGKLPSEYYGVLDPERVRILCQALKQQFDYIFFDAPPIMGISDASVLAGEVDGVLLVIQHRKHPRGVAQRAKGLIEHAGGKLLGVVLNNINVLRDYSYYYQSYYSSYSTEEKRPPKSKSEKNDKRKKRKSDNAA